MGPLFTSHEEWRELHPSGRSAYLWNSVGLTLKAGGLGLAVLILFVGATDPHWRSAPVLAIFVVSLMGAGAGAYGLFRREWQAAENTYGTGE